MKQLDLLSRFVHFTNTARLDPREQGVLPLRFSPALLDSLPASMARIARMNTGVELQLKGHFQRVEITLRVLDTDNYGVNAEAFLNAQKLLPIWHLQTNPDLLQTQSFDLPESDSPSLFRFLFPTHCTLAIHSLRVDSDAKPLPVLDPASSPTRWLVYGDSITQGANLSVPSLAWPALVARQLRLDCSNLALGGHGIAEPQIAADIADRSDLDLLSLHMGANACNAPDQLLADYNSFLATVRRAHPAIPILMVTPTFHPHDLRPDGVVQSLRDSLESLHASLQPRDPNLHLLSGLDILPTPDGLLADNLHLDDRGAFRYAQIMTAALQPLLSPDKQPAYNPARFLAGV